MLNDAQLLHVSELRGKQYVLYMYYCSYKYAAEHYLQMERWFKIWAFAVPFGFIYLRYFASKNQIPWLDTGVTWIGVVFTIFFTIYNWISLNQKYPERIKKFPELSRKAKEAADLYGEACAIDDPSPASAEFAAAESARKKFESEKHESEGYPAWCSRRGFVDATRCFSPAFIKCNVCNAERSNADYVASRYWFDTKRRLLFDDDCSQCGGAKLKQPALCPRCKEPQI